VAFQHHAVDGSGQPEEHVHARAKEEPGKTFPEQRDNGSLEHEKEGQWDPEIGSQVKAYPVEEYKCTPREQVLQSWCPVLLPPGSKSSGCPVLLSLPVKGGFLPFESNMEKACGAFFFIAPRRKNMTVHYLERSGSVYENKSNYHGSSRKRLS
jgi:hypothetical protein